MAILVANASCMPDERLRHAAAAPHVPAAVAAAPAQAPPPAAAAPLAVLLDDGGDAASVATLAPAPPFAAAGSAPEDAARAVACLTEAVYYEARSEPVDGQRAVAQVVLNRVRNPAFPASVCGVVHQRSAASGVCQFTYYCDGAMLRGRIEPEAWDRARRVAAEAFAGAVYAPAGTATFYHTTAVAPWWSTRLARVATIGAHIFYQLGDAIGSRLDFRQAYAGSEPAGAEIARDDLLAANVARFLAPGGETISIHRGAATIAGVVVHRGPPGATATAAADAPAPTLPTPMADETGVSGVRVHRGPIADVPKVAAAKPDDTAGPA